MKEGTALAAPAPREATVATDATRSLLRQAWERWKKTAHAIGVVQTRFLMVVIYVAVALPTGLLLRLLSDPLHLRPPTDGNWTPSHQQTPNLENARRQF